MPTSTVVGALACQKNSFLKSCETVVLSCLEVTQEAKKADKKSKSKSKEQTPVEEPKKQFSIELADTVLFPEGGGQPSDTGTITLPDKSVIKVDQVLRDKLIAKHITQEPIEPGAAVTVNVDWEKRVDYMQQHTGQHLLSAVFDTYNLETLSWAMGDKINYIELPEKISDEILEEVGAKVNELIFKALPISVVTPDSHGEPIDTSHIPDDYDMSKGIVRIVKIGEMDANPCCGTHLSSTLQIQAISLLHQLNVRGGNSKLYFLCGARVYKYLSEQNKILKGSGALLSCQLDEITDKITMLNSNYKKALSRELLLLKELAGIEAQRCFDNFEKNGKDVQLVYRSDNNQEYLSSFQKELSTLINQNKKTTTVDTDKKHTIVLLNGDYPSGSGGAVKLSGPRTEEIGGEIKKRLTNLKGGGKGNLFQGKIQKYEKGELESVLLYLDQFK